MTISIDVATPRLFETFPSFAKQVWDFPTTERFYDWFFYNAPRTKMFVAHDDGEWLACLGVFERDYTTGGERFPCYETYAWASLMSQRSKGCGIKVMKAAFEDKLPMVALGGSRYTEEYMPRLGFSVVAHGPSMILPLRPAAVTGSGAREKAMRAGIGLLGRFLVPGAGSPSLRLVPLTGFSEAILARNGLPGFHSCPDQQFFDWQDELRDLGHFLPLYFVDRTDAPVGWCYARVAEEEQSGGLSGRILETTFFENSTPALRREMMASVVRILAGFGVTSVRALTTCPDTVDALRALRFRSGRSTPAMVYLNGRDLGPDPVRISVLRADGGLLPVSDNLFGFAH